MEAFGFLRSAMAGLSDGAIFKVKKNSGETLMDAVLNPDSESGIIGEELERLRFAREVISELQSKKDFLPSAEFIERLVEMTGYEAVLLAGFHGMQRVGNVRKLIETARKFETGNLGLREFTRYLRRMIESGERETESPTVLEGADCVRLMSIHQAKGLGFRVVFLANISPRKPWISDRVLPGRTGLAVKVLDPETLEMRETKFHRKLQAEADNQDLAEKKRLLYVACTRAKERLIVPVDLSKTEQKDTGDWSCWFNHFLSSARQEIMKFASEGTEQADIEVAKSPEEIKIKFWNAQKMAGETRQAEEVAVEPFLPDIPDKVLERIDRVDISGEMIVSATDLAEVMSGNEGLFSSASSGSAESGSLAHEVLSKVDLALPDDRVEKAVEKLLSGKEGFSAGQLAEIAVSVTTFLKSRFGRKIRQAAMAKTIWREAPVWFRVDSASGQVYIKGVIDLLFKENNVWNVVDYKFSRKPAQKNEVYENQLMIYGLFVSKASTEGDIMAGIKYLLNENGPEMGSFDRKQLEDFEKKITEKTGKLRNKK